jgi:hypothetical protein
MKIEMFRAYLNNTLILFLFSGWFIMGILGCAAIEEERREEPEAVSEAVDQREKDLLEAAKAHAPRLEATFANATIPPRSLWRIYLKGTDPDGDMQFIQVLVTLPWDSSPIRLPLEADHNQSVSGYVSLDTMHLMDFSPWWIRLNVTLEDRAGNRSRIAEFNTTFSPDARRNSPPPGVFDKTFLGKIPVHVVLSPTSPGF